MTFVKEITDLHKNQEFNDDEYQLNFGMLREQYASLPFETAYVVDCKTLDIEYLNSNLGELTGYGSSENDKIAPLYEHVSNPYFNRLTSFIYSLVNFGFKKHPTIQICAHQDFISGIYKTKDNRVIMKTTCSLVNDKSGKMRYTLGKLTDLTDLIDTNEFRYSFKGPNQSLLWAEVNKLAETHTILSSREQQILSLIGRGMSSKLVSEKLCISIHTVHTHRKNIIRKLEASGSIEAYNKAKDLGIF